MSKLSRRASGFTLIELMIVVAIIGILASIAVPSFIKYMKQTKTAEAATNLKAISDGAVTYYEVDHYTTAGLPVSVKMFPTPNGVVTDTSTKRLPADVPRGTKFASTTTMWNEEPWLGLKFQIIKPQYYRYSYKATNNSNGDDLFTAFAEGDLDADSITSRFNVLGRSDESGNAKLTPLFLTDPGLELE